MNQVVELLADAEAVLFLGVPTTSKPTKGTHFKGSRGKGKGSHGEAN